MRMLSSVIAAGLAVVVVVVTATPADAQTARQAPEIREWEVPWANTRPRDPYVAPDGRVWFVGQRADYAAVLDPGTGQFRRYDLPAGAGPHNLIVDDDGIVWYAGNRDRHIGRLDPVTGEIRRFDVPDEDVRDPHTLVFDRQGRILFTAQGSNAVGRFDPATGRYEIRRVRTSNARPYGIDVSPDGGAWAVLVGTNRLLRIDPDMTIREVDLPRSETRPRRVQVTSDGRVWYVDYAAGYLGMYDPARDAHREWRMPRGRESRPYGMAIDARDRLWFVETGPRNQPNSFVGFDPATERFIDGVDVPSGGGTVRHMMYHQATNTVWFGADTNTIGRAVLPR